MTQNINVPKVIYLYDEGIEDFDFPGIKSFIEKNFGKVRIRLVRLKEKVAVTSGLLFNFIETQKAFSRLKYAQDLDACHIILTQRLFATFDQDNRPHIRASIYGYPCIISTSGIVEGPAKPRQYYLYKQRYTPLGLWDMEEQKIKRRLKDRFIDYRDRRMNAVLKGYIAQALFFYITGEPFCKEKACRLFNAHWQEDLIYSQIKEAKFCARHKKILAGLKKKNP